MALQLIRRSNELALDDHICMIYDTEEEHARVLTPYLRTGLERGEKVVYLADYTSGATLMGYLAKAGMDVHKYQSRGQFCVHAASQVYLPNGSFDPVAMIQFLGDATKKALAEGFRGLRATGEMTWVLEGRPGCDRILEYEARTNEFFRPGCRAAGLCQYRRSRFDGRTLLGILNTHPVAGVDGKFYRNDYYIEPEVYLGPRQADAMLDRCLEMLRRTNARRPRAKQNAVGRRLQKNAP